jgi:hypothetical protein
MRANPKVESSEEDDYFDVDNTNFKMSPEKSMSPDKFNMSTDKF